MPKKNLLHSSESLALEFRNRLTRPDTQHRLQYRGIALEYTRVTSATEYDFSWHGQHHYLALHDLVMEDGEMDVEGLSTFSTADIRDTMTFIPPGRPLKGWTKTTGRQNSFTVLHFDPTLLSEETGRIFSGEEATPLVYFQDPKLSATMKKLEGVASDGLTYPSVYVETLALLAALELGALHGQVLSGNRTGRLSTAQQRLLRDYIEEHFTTDVSLDELSHLVHLSRFHLSRRFKTTFGMAPHRYITERRLNAAKQLLKGSDLSIADIAAATGFSSSALLIRTFKLFTGLTPLSFRRA